MEENLQVDCPNFLTINNQETKGIDVCNIQCDQEANWSFRRTSLMYMVPTIPYVYSKKSLQLSNCNLDR